MKFKKILLIFIAIFGLNYAHTTAYDDDAAEVDFYVPGILANDAMSQVNFLLCFMESINFSTFVDAGVYKALTDEAKCENSSDTSGQASATGGSAEGGSGGAAAANEVEATEYTSGIYQGVTSGNAVTGKGWVDIAIDMGNDVEVDVTALISTEVTADKSATNRFGTFKMRYDLRNKAANVAAGLPAPNLPINQGYLSVDNTTIEYRETGMQGPDRIIVADLANPNDIQGYMQTILRIFAGGEPDTIAVRHQIHVNEGSDVYCQKFVSANLYEQSELDGSWSEGAAIDETTLSTTITNTLSGGGQVHTDGGNAGTITNEHCWNTSRSAAKRVIYEYGTYKNSDGERLDLTNPSMSLEANPSETENSALTFPIWAHASYWGVHVDTSDRSNVTDSIVFRNQRNKDDNKKYNLKKNYLEIIKRSQEKLALNQMGGVSFQMYLRHLKEDSDWKARISALGIPVDPDAPAAPLACNATDAECPEYSGTISVSGSVVTFTITHGMDWSASPRVLPFELTTPISFTNTQWTTNMTDGSGWNRGMHFWDPDSHQGYDIPYSAFGNVDATDAEPNDQVRTRIETKIDIETLETDIGGQAGLLCIRECLQGSRTGDAGLMNTAMSTVFAAAEAIPPTAPSSVNVTPYYNVGPFFKEQVYLDGNGNDIVDGGEETFNAGRHNWIGGTPVSEAITYIVQDLGGGKLLTTNGLDGLRGIGWDTDVAAKIDARSHNDAIRNYGYWSKDPTFDDKWQNSMGWGFQMTTVIDSAINRGALYCDDDGVNARNYNNQLKLVSAPDTAAHTGGQESYYCDYKMDSISTTYEIRVKQRPDYRLFDGSNYVNVSSPKKVIFEVPQSGVIYNFAEGNSQPLAGKKYKLKFEGFGELHNIPGRVVDMCTYPAAGSIKGRYVDDWNECYRYIHEFIIPDGTVLTDPSGEDIKVRALSGDEYLLKLETPPAGVTYSKQASDLPAASNIQNLLTGENSIGNVPEITLPEEGSDDPSVIHGETVYAPATN